MKILYNSIKILVLALSVLVSSCTRERDFETESNTGKFKSKLLFNVAQVATKAAITDSDVQRIDILLFSGGKLEKVMRNITSFSTSTGGHSSVEIGVDTEGVRQAYVVANLDNEAWLNSLTVGSTTIEDLASSQTANLIRMANPPLVMYGISPDIDFSTGHSSVMCQLYRAAARIDVDNKASNFTLTSVRLLNAKVASKIFPSGTISDSAVKDFEAEPANESTNIHLYSYENGVSDTETATKVEITGLVNGVLLTYTVDLAQNGSLIPVERNFLYTINVNDVQSNEIDATITVRTWKLGADIDEVVDGNRPVTDITIAAEVGTYSETDSTLSITDKGGEVIFDVRANAECGMDIQGDWLSLAPQTKAASVIESRFIVNITKNTTEIERSATIRIFNKINNAWREFTVTQSGVTVPKEDKYMVLVVAGQSNAVGYDQSPIDAIDLETSNRALQLSYRRGNPDANLSIIPLTWCADDIDQKANRFNESGQLGLKGIHLPLAKELLKYIPSDYKVVVIPVAYTSSAFASSGFGTYNQSLMRPNEMTQVLRWGIQSTYVNTIIDRTQKILSMGSQNKFLGVVWCQGENNYANADYHYTEFTAMAEHILSEINTGYSNRSNYGVIDKRSWYVFSSCTKWVDWYSSVDASGVFGGYKAWNPDTFIHVPSDYPINPSSGGGGGDNHFGKNAYRSIAKLVAERMNINGLLFNGVTPTSNHFRDKTTPAEANLQGGSLNDADVAGSLVLMMPFENSVLEDKKAIGVVSSSGVALSAAEGLVNINGMPRTRNALSLSRTGGSVRVKLLPVMTNWSVSFMFKRTSNLNAYMQTIIPPTNDLSPFIGFKKHSSTSGVAKAAEFIVEPIKTTIKTNAVPGMFMAADRVSSLAEWIHYTITYNNTTKETCIYMNGDLVQKSRIALTTTPSFGGSISIGNFDTNYPGADGQMADLCIWSKTIESSTIKKVFLMSYYGFLK